MVVGGVCTALFSTFFLEEVIQRTVYVSAASVVLLAGILWLAKGLASFIRARELVLFKEAFAQDQTPIMLASANGALLQSNDAMHKTLPARACSTVTEALETRLADPDGAVSRLQKLAVQAGTACESFVTRTGQLRISVHRAGHDQFMWRLDEYAPERMVDPLPDVPMLVANDDNSILFLNDAARHLFGGNPGHLDRVFLTLPPLSGRQTDVSLPNGTAPFHIHKTGVENECHALFFFPTDTNVPSPNDWSVLQRLPVSLLKVDPDGHVVEFNRMAMALVGSLLEPNVRLSDLMEGLGRPITDWLKETVGGRGGQQTEFLRLKRTDKEVFVQVSLNCVHEQEGPALVAVLNDATELKTLEAQFVQSQKMQAIGQLAGGVAHDFNNLLTAISGHCDLLLLRHDRGDPDFNDLVQINQNANRAAALVGQLLAFSRKQTLRPETLDMRDTLSDLTHLLNRLVGEKITLTLQHDPVLQPIRADKRQLEQVIMNLVVNARDAMPEGGEIQIVTEVTKLSEPLERDRVSVPAGSYVTVRVQDDGIGIPPDKLEKVFEPFYTTKRVGEGTGLGLSTAYGIVKQTGGYIFVDSVPGTGTGFSLYFPVLDEQVVENTAPKAAEVKTQAKRGDGVILLVEDEAPVRAFASRALRLRGYTVIEADSAESALETLEDETLNIDVFVTDVVMPGMDGPSWVREALKQRPDVRVVFVSGYAEENFGEAQTRIPNSVFLPKPFSLNDLTNTVQQQMH